MSNFISLQVWDPYYYVGDKLINLVINVSNISHIRTDEDSYVLFLASGHSYNISKDNLDQITSVSNKVVATTKNTKKAKPTEVDVKPLDNDYADDSYLTQIAKSVYKNVIG